MDFYFVLYILVSAVLGLSAVSWLYRRQQTTGAIMTLVLLILIFTFYGLRWFSAGGLKGPEKPGQWPPVVNVCPDFLVAYKDATSKNVYCYDINNAYGLKTAPANEAAKLVASLTINGVSGQSAFLMRDGAQDTTNTLVSLKQEGAAAKWPFLSAIRSNPGAIFTGTDGRQMLRWEGVWDGSSASPEKAPLTY
jgi:hypothetical protein